METINQYKRVKKLKSSLKGTSIKTRMETDYQYKKGEKMNLV